MTLTREEIQGMKPGREMDALIAEKVLGWTDIRRVNPAVIHSFSADGNHANVGFSPVLYKHVPFPLYSTEISAAWEVEERIKELRLHTNYVAALKWVLINTGEYVGMFDYIHANAEQRCKAALLAVLNL